MRYLVFLFVVVAALLSSACVRIKEDLSIKPDGSGSLYIVYGVKDEDLTRMNEVAKRMDEIDPSMGATDVDWMNAFDEKIIRREWSKMKHEGVRLLTVHTEDKDGWRYMRADIRFDSLQKLIDTGMLTECQISLTRGPNGQYGFQQSFNLNKAMKSLPAGMEITSLKPMMDMMMQDFRAEINVSVPGRIIKANADSAAGQNASWALDGSTSGIMERLERFDLRVLFDGRNLNLADAH